MTSSPAGTTMMAARVHAFGAPDVIRYEEVPRPVPGPGEVLVRVAAAAFNPSDIGFRAGLMRDVVPMEPPFVLGSEAAGTVVAAGGGVPGLGPGDRVVGRLDRGGAAAEYVAAPAADLVRAPASIPLAHAAAVPVAGLTAWQALFEHADLAAGDRVLINGAGGGVGMFAVQLARHAGARVIAVAGPRGADRLRGYGVERVVDRTRTAPHEAVDGPVDLVLNLAAIPPAEAAAFGPLVRPGGALVSITVPVELPAGSGATATRFVARNDAAQLAELVALIDAGAVRVDVTARPLADLADVHRDAEAGRLNGKTVLVP
ncbi:NADP-dependent oxidoreductase [Actinomadura viridis]|uniref:NADPH:quinone reductase-like Zn-dependent oxidoreductase n=1 Tax=Actinomadura viridis TaxID=58110 RepID=A0A931DRN0_9ACTN|nr:NADP-dependent oxidoreductase [Actinomadura viridis]MBG6092546.1 NADPH:quinone reductase-like Zn-dependent oxidoreductase [Actinomadura viridis]